MDIKRVNRINFQGREEVLYGLKKAAKEVHEYSVGMQQHIQKLGENRRLANYEAAAKAYLDMVTNDSEFEKVAIFTGKRVLQKTFGNYLKPLESGVKPLEYFVAFINEVMDNNRMLSLTKRSAEKALIERVAEL